MEPEFVSITRAGDGTHIVRVDEQSGHEALGISPPRGAPPLATYLAHDIGSLIGFLKGLYELTPRVSLPEIEE